MKKCPKCHAEIEENARFCLYCMTSFEEKEVIEFSHTKKRRMLYVTSALLVLVLAIGGVFVFVKRDAWSEHKNPTADEFEASSNSTTKQNTALEPNRKSADTKAPAKNPPVDSATSDTKVPTGGTTSSSNTSTGGSGSKLPTGGTASSSNTSTGGTGSDTDTSADDAAPITGSDAPTVVQPSFEYVTATLENTYPIGQPPIHGPENAIAITKVTYTEPDGNYVIPDTVDGKKITAIMPSAFSSSKVSSTVKSVTLPSTVRTIWTDAFKGCYNLKDIYIRSGVIGIYTDAFPEKSKRNYTLTIHCKKDCRDFDFYYYRNIFDKYDALYEEWNG